MESDQLLDGTSEDLEAKRPKRKRRRILSPTLGDMIIATIILTVLILIIGYLFFVIIFDPMGYINISTYYKLAIVFITLCGIFVLYFLICVFFKHFLELHGINVSEHGNYLIQVKNNMRALFDRDSFPPKYLSITLIALNVLLVILLLVIILVPVIDTIIFIVVW